MPYSNNISKETKKQINEQQPKTNRSVGLHRKVGFRSVTFGVKNQVSSYTKNIYFFLKFECFRNINNNIFIFKRSVTNKC